MNQNTTTYEALLALDELIQKQNEHQNETISKKEWSEIVNNFAERFSVGNRKYVFQLIRRRREKSLDENNILKELEDSDLLEWSDEAEAEVIKISKYLFAVKESVPEEINVTLDDKTFTICKEDLQDILLCLANSYNRWAINAERKVKLDRDRLRSAMMYQLLDERINKLRNTKSVSALYKLSLVFRSLKYETTKINPNLKTFFDVCHELAPEKTKEEIISLIHKYKPEY